MCHLLECQSGLVAVLVSEVVVHAEVGLPAELIARLAVRDALNYAALEETCRVFFFYTHMFSALFIYTPEH